MIAWKGALEEEEEEEGRGVGTDSRLTSGVRGRFRGAFHTAFFQPTSLSHFSDEAMLRILHRRGLRTRSLPATRILPWTCALQWRAAGLAVRQDSSAAASAAAEVVNLARVGQAVVQTADPNEKVARILETWARVQELDCAQVQNADVPSLLQWRPRDGRAWSDRLATDSLPTPIDEQLPREPCRPPTPPLVDGIEMQRPEGFPLPVYLLHSLAHIELNAIGACDR